MCGAREVKWCAISVVLLVHSQVLQYDSQLYAGSIVCSRLFVYIRLVYSRLLFCIVCSIQSTISVQSTICAQSSMICWCLSIQSTTGAQSSSTLYKFYRCAVISAYFYRCAISSQWSSIVYSQLVQYHSIIDKSKSTLYCQSALQYVVCCVGGRHALLFNLQYMI